MKILGTGGAGFIGSNIANSLADERRNEVIALVDLSLGIASNLSASVRFVKGSVRDPQLIQEVFKGCDFIFHEATQGSFPMFKDSPFRHPSAM